MTIYTLSYDSIEREIFPLNMFKMWPWRVLSFSLCIPSTYPSHWARENILLFHSVSAFLLVLQSITSSACVFFCLRINCFWKEPCFLLLEILLEVPNTTECLLVFTLIWESFCYQYIPVLLGCEPLFSFLPQEKACDNEILFCMLSTC